MKNIKKSHVYVGLAAGVAALGIVLVSGRSESSVSPELHEQTASLIEAPQKRVSDAGFIANFISGAEVKEFKIASGDTLGKLLSSVGITAGEQAELTGALRPLIKPSELRLGDTISIKYKTSGSANEVLSFDIIKSPIYKIHAARKAAGGFEVSEQRAGVSANLSRGSGTIAKGASLIETATTQGIPYNIIDKFYEVFSFDVDFERDIYPGDTFTVMYEKLYTEDGSYLGAGEMIYASLSMNSRKAEYKLYRYENEKGAVSYFDENGRSNAKTLKKTPINGARISSKFGYRKHPVLGYTRAHRGVDFAAPSGTSIPAGGSGTVVAKGYDGGYGNYVKIRHNGAYTTLYGHMSGFKKGIAVGSRVNQGQIIGYVGSTGLSTGPHLHYEIHKDGQQVNPLTIKLPANITLADAEKGHFAQIRDRINLQYAVLSKNLPFTAWAK